MWKVSILLVYDIIIGHSSLPSCMLFFRFCLTCICGQCPSKSMWMELLLFQLQPRSTLRIYTSLGDPHRKDRRDKAVTDLVMFYRRVSLQQNSQRSSSLPILQDNKEKRIDQQLRRTTFVHTGQIYPWSSIVNTGPNTESSQSDKSCLQRFVVSDGDYRPFIRLQHCNIPYIWP